MENFVIVLALVGIVDAISYMVVSPSIVFYVLANGGTKEQYGIILSSFSFASFCAKPIVGFWSDRKGFRVPYIATLIISAIGGFYTSWLLQCRRTQLLASYSQDVYLEVSGLQTQQ
mmetsp:Transcript_24833/g.38274  ORF Transcript_24833/g.38274 Transcript_24833/m.38274 type:complete len:116 (+) Transcript_24833:54-401(+)